MQFLLIHGDADLVVPLVTEPQLLRVIELEPLRLLLVNLVYLGKWSFPGLNQLL